MKLLHDTHDVSDDKFGFAPIADALHIAIKETDPPFTIGIFGEWGCGKTTLMRMVKKRLEDDGQKTVWFNAWKYDGKEVIWNSLIQEIFYQIQNDAELKNNESKKEFIEHVKKTSIELAKYAAKVTTRFIPGNIIKEDDVDKIYGAFSGTDPEHSLSDFVNKFEKNFDEIVRSYIGDTGKLIIFIDDLDRCLPENAILVLESIKLYLDRTNCMFVIAAERAIVEEGIRHRYKDNVRLSAKDYLEKIVQLPFSMRGIEPQNVLSLLEPYAEIADYKNDPLMETLIVEGTNCNPRRLKQFINSLYVLSKVNEVQDTEKIKTLAKVLMVQICFPELYNALLQDLNIMNFLTQVLLESDSRQRQEKLAFGSQTAKDLYENQGLKNFLEKTKAIRCDEGAISQWVLLTQGSTSSAA